MTREEREVVRSGYRAPASEAHLRGTIGLLLDSHDEADKVIEQLREELASVLGAQREAALAAGVRA